MTTARSARPRRVPLARLVLAGTAAGGAAAVPTDTLTLGNGGELTVPSCDARGERLQQWLQAVGIGTRERGALIAARTGAVAEGAVPELDGVFRRREAELDRDQRPALRHRPSHQDLELRRPRPGGWR